MDFIMKTPVTIRCNKCGNTQEISPDSFDHDSGSIGERGMGDEIEHTFTATDTCDNCGNYFEVTISEYEYPVGAYDSGPDATRESGCTVTKLPDLESDYSDEMDEPYDENDE